MRQPKFTQGKMKAIQNTFDCTVIDTATGWTVATMATAYTGLATARANGNLFSTSGEMYVLLADIEEQMILQESEPDGDAIGRYFAFLEEMQTRIKSVLNKADGYLDAEVKRCPSE